MTKTMLTRDDIMDMAQYAKVRKEHRAQMTEKKRNRRLHCGPHATFYFESFDTMWHQVHEMMFIETKPTAMNLSITILIIICFT